MSALISKDYEILSSEKFKANVIKILSNHVKDPSLFIPSSFPILKRYSRLDSYTVNDIIKKELTLSRIGEFNDMFDGVVNIYHSRADFEDKVRKDWQLIESILKTGGMPISENGYSDFLSLHERSIDSKPNMLLLDHIGTFVGCFTTDDKSKLMWSHYADKNTGICVSYDFNRMEDNNLLKNLIYPVIYADNPIVFPDELENSIDDYLHIKIICSALCKSIDWKYENEWRMIFLLPLFNIEEIRVPVTINLYPEKISFGYHFLKKIFIHERIKQDTKALEDEKKSVTNHIKILGELLSFMIENNIKAEYVVPSIGNYNLTPKSIDIVGLKNLIENRFCQGRFYDIRFYHNTQNELFDLTK